MKKKPLYAIQIFLGISWILSTIYNSSLLNKYVLYMIIGNGIIFCVITIYNSRKELEEDYQ